jgi:hypothetical protein
MCALLARMDVYTWGFFLCTSGTGRALPRELDGSSLTYAAACTGDDSDAAFMEDGMCAVYGLHGVLEGAGGAGAGGVATTAHAEGHGGGMVVGGGGGGDKLRIRIWLVLSQGNGGVCCNLSGL